MDVFSQQGKSKEIGDKATEGNAYTNLGTAYGNLGDYKGAIKFHQQSLRIAKEIGNKGLEGAAYGNLGNAYYSLGDSKKAIESYQQSLSVVKEIGDKWKVYANLGGTYTRLGDYEKTREILQQSLSIAKEIGNKDLEGAVYANLGSCESNCLGDSKKEIKFEQQSLRIAKETGNKRLELQVYNRLGASLFKRLDFHEAEKYFESSIKVFEEMRFLLQEKDEWKISLRDTLETYRYLWIVQLQQNKTKEALLTAERGRAQALADLMESQYGAKSTPSASKERIERTTNISSLVSSPTTFLVEAFESVFFWVLNKGQEWQFMNKKINDTLKDMTDKAYKQIVVAKPSRCEDRSLADSEDEAIEDLPDTHKGTGGKEFTSSQAGGDALRELYDAMIVPISHLIEDEELILITNISSLISSPTTFLAEASGSVFFWVLQTDQKLQFTDKILSYTLEDMTNKAYEQIRATKPARCEDRSLDDPDNESIEDLSDRDANENEFTSSRAGGDALKELYDVVIAPISHLIKDEELVIVPDGSSFLIPYAALLDQNSRYLSETLRIRLAPSLTSLRLLSECQEGRHYTTRALLVGNPWIETVRIEGEKIEQLPGAEEEVKMIGEILDVEPLTGKNATKEQVLSRLNSVSLVHVAAHGSAERGEILLSPNHGSSNPPEETDCLLTMTDVLNAKLDAKLVVLSCCHSGRGKIKAEGVVGIARAFLGAGARSVIASLWAIDDEATLAFMEHFYKHLVKGQSASKSLHEDMKMMRESDEFNAVMYQAPFMLIGDDVTLNLNQ